MQLSCRRVCLLLYTPQGPIPTLDHSMYYCMSPPWPALLKSMHAWPCITNIERRKAPYSLLPLIHKIMHQWRWRIFVIFRPILDFQCGPTSASSAAYEFTDSRMTPALCTFYCMTNNYGGYAFIKFGNQCWCEDNTNGIPTFESSSCDRPCLVEPWMSCGSTDEGIGLFRTLANHGVRRF